MPSYVVFLRAVNVGKRQVKMASLREWLEEDGFTDVETYIQTGNVKVSTSMRSPAKVEQRIEQLLLDKCGFDVPCIVFTPAELKKVHADAEAMKRPPYADRSDCKRYVVFFKKAPTIPAYQAELERIHVVGRAAHIWITGGMADAKIFKELAKPLDPGTNRNHNVLTTLAEKWGG